MANTMQVQLVSPERAVWSGEAVYVGARTVVGGIGIYAGHEPVLATLVGGIIKITPESGEDILAAVTGGFLSVTAEGVSVLAEGAELREDIDVDAARRDLETARNAGSGDPEAAALRRSAEARLELAGQSA